MLLSLWRWRSFQPSVGHTYAEWERKHQSPVTEKVQKILRHKSFDTM